MGLDTIVLDYFIIINVTTAIVYGLDKLCAIKNWWRVPEITLLGVALIGGSVGALLSMMLFRHKTKHLKFKYGVPGILLFHIFLIIWLYIS